MAPIELTPEEQGKVDEILPLLKIKMMARQIIGDDHLEAILRDAQPAMRRQVYELVKPYLTFKPKSFLVMKFKKMVKNKPKQLKPVIAMPANSITIVRRAGDAVQ